MRSALAIWSYLARLISRCLTLPEWRSCHERSIWRNQLEPAEEGLRPDDCILARTLPCRVCRCRRMAKPKRDGRDATDPSAWNGRIPAAEFGAVHRPPEPLGPAFSSTAL